MLPNAQSDAQTETTLTWTTPSLRRRMACWFYEGMLLFGVLFVAGYLFGTLSQTKHALHNRHGLQAFLFLVFAIYFTWLWSKGQTLAMKTWHIRVVDTSGQPLTQARALWRYVHSVSGIAQVLAQLGLVFTSRHLGLPIQTFSG